MAQPLVSSVMPKTIQFIKSAVLAKDYPVHNMAEVAIAGRSNAGKSSFINGLAKRIIAKVSSTPGKTRLLNFFNMEDSYVLTDMPGYGFAARSGNEQREWHQMIETYLTSRESLRGLILVMDIRRSWTEDEEIMRRFSEREGFPIVIVLAKSDKLSHGAKLQAVEKMKKVTGLSAVFAASATKKEGTAEVERYIFENWIKE